MISAIVGGAMSMGSSYMTNEANKDIARENRKWAEQMSNTAHQREVDDLTAAGLNPILSATGGSGAPTVAPPQQAPVTDVVTPGISTALDVYKTNADTELKQAHVDVQKAEAVLKHSQIPSAKAKEALTQQLLNLTTSTLDLFGQDTAGYKAMIEKSMTTIDQLVNKIISFGGEMTSEVKEAVQDVKRKYELGEHNPTSAEYKQRKDQVSQRHDQALQEIPQ